MNYYASFETPSGSELIVKYDSSAKRDAKIREHKENERLGACEISEQEAVKRINDGTDYKE